MPLYAAVSVALTWPLALHVGDRLAYGAEPTTTVPLFNLWTLRWNQDRLGHGLSGYWDAPIFHPASGSFALSEPQPLTGLVFAPISWVTGNPVLAFNVVALAVARAQRPLRRPAGPPPGGRRGARRCSPGCWRWAWRSWRRRWAWCS